MNSEFKNVLKLIFTLFLLIGISNIYSQSTVIDDALKGSTDGAKKGGSFNGEGYAPGKGSNHILYDVPKQIANGYIEFEMKGFSSSMMPKDEDHGFLAIYDGRGISEPITYSNAFKHNYFRWNIHWRQNKNAFKAVIACAAPTSSRMNSSKAVFTDKNRDGLDSHDRDWYTEPTGSGQSWNTSTWYTVKVQWKNKKFEVFVNGIRKWSASGPYDYNPVDLKIWLGSAPGKYDSDVNVTYRNFKLVDLGGSGSGTTNTLSVTPSNQSVGSSSGSTTFSVSSNVSWSVSDNASWLTVSPSSGSNGKTLTATYSTNSSSSSRTATITTSGGGITKKVTVTQSGSSGSGTTNTLSVTPSNQSVSSSSGSTTFSVSSNVSWSVSDNASWLTVSPSSGSNGKTLTATFSKNTGSSSRTATITTTGSKITQKVTVTQSGSSGSGGTGFSVSPASKNLDNGSGSFNIDISSSGSWRVRDNTDWLSKSPKTGSGNGTSKINYKANTTGKERSGIVSVTVGSITKEIVVTQGSGGSSSGGVLTVSPTTKSLGAGSGTFNIFMTTSGSWRVRDNTDWLSKKPKTGTGNGTSKITYKTNTTGKARSGIISVTVGSTVKEISVTQSASGSVTVAQGGSSVTDAKVNETEKQVKLPTSYALNQNYPNPFNPSTKISFDLPNSGNVKLDVYNLLGEKVVSLLNGELSAGHHSFNFDASNLAAGAYIYTIKTSKFVESKKMILLK